MGSAIEGFLVLAWLWFFASQVGWPIMRGTPLFPLFKARHEKQLRRQLADAEQARLERELEAKIEEVRSQERAAAEASVAQHAVRAFRQAVTGPRKGE